MEESCKCIDAIDSGRNGLAFSFCRAPILLFSSRDIPPIDPFPFPFLVGIALMVTFDFRNFPLDLRVSLFFCRIRLAEDSTFRKKSVVAVSSVCFFIIVWRDVTWCEDWVNLQNLNSDDCLRLFSIGTASQWPPVSYKQLRHQFSYLWIRFIFSTQVQARVVLKNYRNK